jgi:aromatic ring hydroxylase
MCAILPRDGRTIYLDGKLVGDVTEHPAFRNAVHSAAALYDFQARPENLGSSANATTLLASEVKGTAPADQLL